MAENEVKIKLTVEGNAKKQIEDAAKSVKSFADSAKENFSKATQAFSTFAGFLGAQAVGAIFRGITAAARELFDTFIVDGVRAAQVQEDAINQLNQALKASGIYTKETSESLQEYAAELQSVTKYGDETILQTQALIQSLGQLDEKGLKQATKATLDLSAALGIDLNTAALLVGKAAAGEVGSFSRYGLSIKKASTNAETFARVLEAVNDKFGGAAEAQVNTFSGAVAQLSNSFGDLTEKIGFAITKNESIVGVVKAVNSAFGDFSKVIEANQDAIASFIRLGLVTLVKALEVVVGAFNKTISFFTGYQIKFQEFTIAYTEGLEKLFGKTETWTNTIKSAREQLEGWKTSQEALTGVLGAAEEALVAIDEQLTVNQENQAERFDEDEEQHERKLARSEELTEAQLKEKEAIDKKLDAIIKAGQTEQQKLDEQFAFVLKDSNRRHQNSVKLYEAEKALLKKRAELEKKNAEERAKVNKETHDRIVSGTSQFFGNLSSLTQVKNKELFEIGKAAATAGAIVDTYASATKAFNALAGIPIVGPALGAAAAAAAIVAGLVRVSQIQSTQFKAQEGITEVPGPKGAGDVVSAMLSPGERVVDAGTNEDLKAFLAGSSGQTALLSSIDEKLTNLNNQIVVNVGGEEIVNQLLDQQRGGRSLEVA